VEDELGTFLSTISRRWVYTCRTGWGAATHKPAANIKSGGTFIDVGANIGLTPVASNRSVRCYGF